MIMKETNTILSAIVTASEKLEGSKLEDSVLKEIEGELTRIADYIKAVSTRKQMNIADEEL